jgi:hypothetical protein
VRARVGKEQGLIRIAIRISTKLHRDLETMAKATDRSLNYEITMRLKASIKLDEILDAKTPTETLELVDKLRLRMRDLRLSGEEHD